MSKLVKESKEKIKKEKDREKKKSLRKDCDQLISKMKERHVQELQIFQKETKVESKDDFEERMQKVKKDLNVDSLKEETVEEKKMDNVAQESSHRADKKSKAQKRRVSLFLSLQLL